MVSGAFVSFYVNYEVAEFPHQLTIYPYYHVIDLEPSFLCWTAGIYTSYPEA